MASVPGVGGEVKTRNAVSKLVKIPGRDIAESNGNTLYEKLLQKAVDLAYEDVFTRARGQEAKLSLLKVYVQQPEAYTSNSVTQDLLEAGCDEDFAPAALLEFK